MNKADIDNRFDYYAAKEGSKRKETHDSIRTACKTLAELINEKVPDGREKSTAITKLEEAMFWANAGIARPQIEEPF